MSSQREFPNDAASPASARHFALDALGAVTASVSEAVALLVSELATNAVRHTGSCFTVAVDRTSTRVRVAVTDDGAGEPIVRAPEPIEPSGRGLRLVEALAADWGIEPARDGPGKTVWFTVDVEPRLDEAAYRGRAASEQSDRGRIG